MEDDEKSISMSTGQRINMRNSRYLNDKSIQEKELKKRSQERLYGRSSSLLSIDSQDFQRIPSKERDEAEEVKIPKMKRNSKLLAQNEDICLDEDTYTT